MLPHARRQYTVCPPSIHVVVQVRSQSPHHRFLANSSFNPRAFSLALSMTVDVIDGGLWLLGCTHAQNCCMSRCSLQMYSPHLLHGSPRPSALTSQSFRQYLQITFVSRLVSAGPVELADVEPCASVAVVAIGPLSLLPFLFAQSIRVLSGLLSNNFSFCSFRIESDC